MFLVWDREIGSHSRFCHHYVTSDLPHPLPARFAEGTRGFLAGNIAEPPHPLSRQPPSNSDDHWSAIGPKRLHRLLILGPQPRGHRFLDVLQGCRLAAPSRPTSATRPAMRSPPTVACFFTPNLDSR